jgi:DNA-directed RNA polymerase alpha subunit
MSDVKKWGEQGLISARTKNALINANIHTLDDLVKWSMEELLLIPNFGRKSLNEVTDILHGVNLRLKRPRREFSPWEQMAAQKLREAGWSVLPPPPE